MRVGVLTGGGDCPGLNAVIRALVRKGELHFADEFIGFNDGWRGVIENRTSPLDIEPATARKRYGRALLRLRKVLSDCGLLESQP